MGKMPKFVQIEGQVSELQLISNFVIHTWPCHLNRHVESVILALQALLVAEILTETSKTYGKNVK